MATNINDLIFIKRVKKAHHDEAHGGAWKIAYADFVTAMMAFFLLMWLLNATTEDQRTAISNYFAPASVSQSMSGAGGVLGGRTIDEEGAMAARHSSPRVLLGNPSPILGNAREESEQMVGSFTRRGPVEDHTFDDASGSHMGPLDAHDQAQGEGAFLGTVKKKTDKSAKEAALGAGNAPKDFGPGEGEGVSPVKGDKQGFDARQGPHDNTEFDPTIAHGQQQSLANRGDQPQAVRQPNNRMPRGLTTSEAVPYQRHFAEENRFAQAERALKQAIASDPQLKKFEKNFKIDRSDAGLRIQMVDDEKKAMFPLGSAEMLDLTSQLLGKVAAMVKPMSNKIVIAGHTDAIPYRSGSGYSNWELSTDRAHAARRSLVEAGVPEERIISVSGKAATDPLIKADPKAAGNRRISILLMRENPTADELNRNRAAQGRGGFGGIGNNPYMGRGQGRTPSAPLGPSTALPRDQQPPTGAPPSFVSPTGAAATPPAPATTPAVEAEITPEPAEPVASEAEIAPETVTEEPAAATEPDQAAEEFAADGPAERTLGNRPCVPIMTAMIDVAPSVLMWTTLGLGALTIVGYANRRIPLELTSVSLLGLLLVLFAIAPLPIGDGSRVLDAAELLRGFANPALIAVAALLVIGQGMVRTGALDVVSDIIFRISRGSPAIAFALTLSVALVVSGALNNTPVVVMFIPVLTALAERLGRGVGRIMMPLSFAAILGGMTTLIGSSTNLLVSGTAADLGLEPLGFFDFTIPGLVLAGIGLLYVQFVAPRLLPERPPEPYEVKPGTGKQFIAQFTIEPGSELVGQRAVGGLFPAFRDLTVLRLQRAGDIIPPPYDDVALEAGDTIVVATTRNALTNIVARARWFQLGGGAGEDDDETNDKRADDRARPGNVLAEAMVSPGSRMVGLPLEQIAFPAAENITVLGVQRRSRMTRSNIHAVRLEAGDVLLLQGRRDGLRRLRANRDVVLMEWSALELRAYHHARRATLIFVAVVGLAAAGVLPISVTAVAGAALMVASGALNIRQAARAIDRQIILVGAAALSLNAALTATGGAAYVAHGFLSIMDGAGPAWVLSIFFLLVAIFTNLLSNQACAVLFTPIAIGLAASLGVDPVIFVIAVVLAANCSFATPISYITNMLVMAPGRYRFVDFVRAGVPLIALLWIGFTLFAGWYYDLW